MPPRAVLFDFDGVLADTENIHVAAWERTFADLGWVVPDEVCARAMEVEDRLFLAEIFASRKIEGGDVEGWVRRKQRLTAAMLADSPRIYPGAAELVRRLSGRVRIGIVSTTWRENLDVVLAASGLADAFEVLVGKEDVAAAKPDPEAYVLALERLRLPAGAAVALEDSESGLQAARGAAIRAIAVGHRKPPGEWVGPSQYVPDLTEASNLIGLLGLA
jgi:beta-phosphoglucomutase